MGELCRFLRGASTWPSAGSGALCRFFLQLRNPVLHEMPVVMEGAAAHEVAIHHARFVHVDSATDFKVELALRHGRHATSADAIGARGDFHAMAHAGAG